MFGMCAIGFKVMNTASVHLKGIKLVMLQVGPGLAGNIFLAPSCSSMNKAVVSHVTRHGSIASEDSRKLISRNGT